MAEMLVDKAQYLTAGIHIGMKTCTPYMRQFVYKTREDGLSVFNLQMVDERIKKASDFISGFDNVLAVSRKEGGQKAVRAFAKAVGGKAIAGRFTPGTLTNPSYREFFEPDLVIVTDPLIDDQTIKEAKKKRIPIVALCDTFNMAKDVDFVIPVNNNGKKSLALVFWILAKEVLKTRGMIKSDAEFTPTLEDFGDEDKTEELPGGVDAEEQEPAAPKKPKAAAKKAKPAPKKPKAGAAADVNAEADNAVNAEAPKEEKA